MKQPFIAAATLTAAIALAGCSPQPANEQIVIGNAVAVEENIADDADDRADHLDEAAAELSDEAKRAGGVAGRELRNESNADLADAAQVRESGDIQSVDARDQIEQKGGAIGNGN